MKHPEPTGLWSGDTFQEIFHSLKQLNTLREIVCKTICFVSLMLSHRDSAKPRRSLQMYIFDDSESKKVLSCKTTAANRCGSNTHVNGFFVEL